MWKVAECGYLRGSPNWEQQTVKRRIDAREDVNIKGQNGKTPLHLADSREVAELLISKGTDINARDLMSQIPSHSTGSNDLRQFTEVLIENGSDVNAKDKNCIIPLDVTESAARAFTRIGSKEGMAVWTATTELFRKHGMKTGEELEAEGK